MVIFWFFFSRRSWDAYQTFKRKFLQMMNQSFRYSILHPHKNHKTSFQGIEDNYEQIKENYPSLIEETQLQVYENVLPESTILRIGQKFVYGETFIHTELRSIALFFIMAMSFNF